MLAKPNQRRGSVILLFFLFAFCAKAQKTISGTVSTTTNQPIYGASVLVKGAKSGTTTDAQGRYTITVPSDQSILVVTYVGYGSREIPVAGKRTFEIALPES
jgi:hypothetical protein